MYCENCGTKFEPEDQFCVTCGARRGELIDYTPEDEEKQSDKPPKKKKIWMIFVILGVILLIGIAAAAIFFFGKDNDQGDKSVTEAEKDINNDEALEETIEETDEAEESELEDSEEPETQESEIISDTDPVAIAEQVLGMEYLSEGHFIQQYYNSPDGSIHVMTIARPRTVCAHQYDYDGDGADEIFVVAIHNERYPIWFCMLEQTDGVWDIGDDFYPSRGEVPPHLYDANSSYEWMNVFTKEDSNGNTRIYLEDISNDLNFSDRFTWDIYCYTYLGNKFVPVMEPTGIEGSLTSESVSIDGAPAEGEEGMALFMEFMGKLSALDLDADKLSVDTSIIFEDIDAYELIRIVKNKTLSEEEKAALLEGSVSSGVGDTTVSIYNFINEDLVR